METHAVVANTYNNNYSQKKRLGCKHRQIILQEDI